MARPKKKPARLHWLHNSRFRPVRWRYERIMSLVDSRPRVKDIDPAIDDEFIRGGRDFQVKWNKAGRGVSEEKAEERREQLIVGHPGLFFAREIYMHPQQRDRHELEARILSGQSDEQIAELMAITPEVVAWFEAIFFNVRDRLHSRSYISSHVIGPIIGTGLQNVTLELSAKFFAYYGGPFILDWVLQGFNPTTAPAQSNSDLNAWMDGHVEGTLRRRSGEQANAFEINRYNVMQLFEIHANMIEANRRLQLEEGVKTNLEENIMVMLSSIPWSVGARRQEQLKATPLGGYSGHVAEPRASEMLQIAGDEIPTSVIGLKDLELPPPREKKRDEEGHKPILD